MPAKAAAAGADELYGPALAIVIQEKRVSVACIRRKLKIGYNRTISLVEKMKAGGAVSKPDGSANCEVHVIRASELSVGRTLTAHMHREGFEHVTVTMKAVA